MRVHVQRGRGLSVAETARNRRYRDALVDQGGGVPVAEVVESDSDAESVAAVPPGFGEPVGPVRHLPRRARGDRRQHRAVLCESAAGGFGLLLEPDAMLGDRRQRLGADDHFTLPPRLGALLDESAAGEFDDAPTNMQRVAVKIGPAEPDKLTTS